MNVYVYTYICPYKYKYIHRHVLNNIIHYVILFKTLVLIKNESFVI